MYWMHCNIVLLLLITRRQKTALNKIVSNWNTIHKIVSNWNTIHKSRVANQL